MVKAPTPGSKAFDLQQMRERRAKHQSPNNRHASPVGFAKIVQDTLQTVSAKDSKPSSAPVQASAQQPEPEDTMAPKKKTKAKKPAGKKRGVGEAAANRKKAIQAAKAAKKSKPKKAKAPKAAGESDRGDTQRKIGELLCRPEGATAKDVLALTGWDAVSVPPVAKRLGITLRKEKVEGERGVRYFGTQAGS